MRTSARLFVFACLYLLALPAATFAAESFIAQSPKNMDWFAAKNFCESKGAKLPLVNNADILTKADKGMTVDGIGVIGDKWSSELDGSKFYWLGTAPTPAPHRRAYVVGTSRGAVRVSETMSGGESGVVCVPK